MWSKNILYCLLKLFVHHQIVAVAARDLQHAEEFAKKHNIPRAYGGYDELAKDPGVGELPVKHISSCYVMNRDISAILNLFSPVSHSQTAARLLVKFTRKKSIILFPGSSIHIFNSKTMVQPFFSLQPTELNVKT